MSYVTPIPPPGSYREALEVSFEFDPRVVGVSLTTNSLPPSISKYIAYDTLNPPNPFLAVTQDGRGNVVYDGGFPKFYNANAPAPSVTTFAELNGAGKFLYNAIDFVAHKERVAVGNRKVLLIGDAVSGESYWVKGTGFADFQTTFTRIVAVGGWTLTIKDANDWGGSINCSLAELEEYAAIIVMSSVSTGVARITSSAVADLVTYRNRGGGLIVITDHGPDLASAEEAAAANYTGAFFNLANRIVTNFGAWFSGNYDRSPVSVGYIRANYGDHPLYKNMSDSETIAAGGSESRVFVTTSPQFPKEEVAPVLVEESGNNTINILVELDDGTIESYRFVYVVADWDIVEFLDGSTGDVITHMDLGLKDRYLPIFRVRGEGLGTLLGHLYRNDNEEGEFIYNEASGIQLTLNNGGEDLPVNDGDVIRITIYSPFQYSSSLTIGRFQPSLKATTLHGVLDELAPYNPSLPREERIRALLQALKIERPEIEIVNYPDLARLMIPLREAFRRI